MAIAPTTPPPTRWRTDLALIVALVILPLLMFWPVTLGGKTLLPADNLFQYQPWAAYREQLGVPAIPHNALLSDLVLQNYQWKQFIRASLAQGELPLWNPYLFAGVPFLAAGQHSALYPFSLIYYALPLDQAYGWFTVSQLWLAGVTMYLLMRGLGRRRFGAIIAALAFQGCNFFIASAVFPMILASAAWLPLLLLMVEYTFQRRPLFGKPTAIPWILIGAGSLGMTILGGHVEFVYYALLVMGFWAAWRLIGRAIEQRREGWSARRALIPRAGSLLALVILGLALGAVQFLPLLELGGRNFREGRTPFETVQSYALPVRHVALFMFPNLYGSPAQHDYFDVFTRQMQPIDWQVNGQRVTNTEWPGGKNYVEGACYVGLLTLILAALGVIDGCLQRRPRSEQADSRSASEAGNYRVMFGVMALIALSFAFGSITYAVLYYGFPGLNQLHSPFRWVFPLTLCLAALAGYGADAVTQARTQRGTAMFRAVTVAAVGCIALGVAIIGGLVAGLAFFAQIRPFIESLWLRLAGASYVFPNVETFFSVIFTPLVVGGLVLLSSGVALLLSRIRNGWPWMFAATLILAIDLGLATTGFNPAADPQWLRFEPPALTWLQAHDPTNWRFTTVQGSTATLNANAAWMYGLQDIRGYDSMIPKQYVEYMRQIQPQSMLMYNRIAPIFPDQLSALDSPALNGLAVKYILSEMVLDLTVHPQLIQVYSDQAVTIYENRAALPRAYVIDPAAPTTSQATSVAEIIPAEIIKAANNEVTVAARNPRTTPVTLVLADSYFPGWRAYLRATGSAAESTSEIEVPITVWEGNFRAVTLPAGDWTVRFRYAPPSFQVGAFASFISAMVLIFLLLVWLWNTFVAAEADSNAARRFAKNSLAPIFLNLFNRGIDFAFAAIMLRILGPAAAGVYYYAVVVFGWFDTLTNFGLNLLLIREVSQDRAGARRYLLNSSVLRLGLALAGIPLLAGFLLIRGAVAEPLDMTTIAAIALLYVGLVPNSISYGLSALYYAFEKAEIPAAISTVSAILKAAFGLGALLLGWGVVGLAGVSILLNLITLIILGWGVRGLLREQTDLRPARIEPPLIRAMVGQSFPLMLNNLLAGLFFKIDVTLLEPIQGKVVVGQYSTAYKWIDALGVVPSLFTMALLPIMSRQAKEDRIGMQRNYQFAVKLLVSAALPVAVVTTFLAVPLIGALGGAAYLPDGAIALQLMIWFAPIGWINSLTNYVLIALDQQRLMRWAFLAGVVFNVTANLIFIPLYSYRAAAVITILSELVLLTGFYLLLRRAMGTVPWVRMLWKPVFAAALMVVILAALTPISALLGLLVASAVYLVLLVGFRAFDAAELAKVAALLPSRLRRLIAA